MGVEAEFDFGLVQLGIKIMMPLGPLGPNLSEKEWNKWLDYIPEFQRQRMDYLSDKRVAELTDKELDELEIYRKELKMKTVSENYANKETSIDDRIEYIEYITQEQLDSLIRSKLTAEEYKNAVEKCKKIVNTLSYEELKNYCELMEDNFDNLSMTDLFVLREANRELLVQADKKSEKRLSHQLEKNRIMGHNSMIEASKHIVF